jgi:putative ABC transport system ATP-binding protein
MPTPPASTSSASGLELGHLATTLSDGDRRFRLAVEGLRLDRGTVWALTGNSGTGKTLFLEMLGLLRAPAPGSRLIWHESGQQTDLCALWREGPRGADLARFRGAVFGFVPQTGGLVPFLSAQENIGLTQAITGRRDPARIARLVERLGLGAVLRLPPAALSIGQRQRVAIARALAHRPAFVLADEPTSALDPETAETVMTLLLEQAAEEGAGVILSSHDHQRLQRPGLTRLHFAAQPADGQGMVASRAQVQPC